MSRCQGNNHTITDNNNNDSNNIINDNNLIMPSPRCTSRLRSLSSGSYTKDKGTPPSLDTPTTTTTTTTQTPPRSFATKNRSSSVGSYSGAINSATVSSSSSFATTTSSTTIDQQSIDTANQLFHIAIQLCKTNASPLHAASNYRTEPSDLALVNAFLERAGQSDHLQTIINNANNDNNNNNNQKNYNNNNNNTTVAMTRQSLLTATQIESGYTPLHSAILRQDLSMILLLLRHATTTNYDKDIHSNTATSSSHKHHNHSYRMLHRPMDILHNPPNNNNNNTLTAANAMTQARDYENWKPADLLAYSQRPQLQQCRQWLQKVISTTLRHRTNNNNNNNKRFRRGSSISFDDHHDDNDEQNELDALSQYMAEQQAQLLHEQQTMMELQNQNNNNDTNSYGCEVITFGRAHHCALGVVASNKDNNNSNNKIHRKDDPNNTTLTVRPQRVQAFAQETVKQSGSAILVAGARYHTLVATAKGHLFAFGLGKGGRLGTGDESPCSSPTRIMGPLKSRRVVGISAAENHSLCVTSCGYVFAWGSNRFGQLGNGTGNNNNNNNNYNSQGSTSSSSLRCLPRRVDDLKTTFCISVAAGAKHSVALSDQGEVYVWGDNTAGQLGISRRNGIHKPQRVEALWNATPRKVTKAIAASEEASLVLTLPHAASAGLPINSIYSWGHGNHVPCKVHFNMSSNSSSSWKQHSTTRGRPINPIAIDCARYHNVAITSDGCVYTWGLHAEPLGTKPKQKSIGTIAAPQLVTGMLPENGGGFAVAVSASENHTAVVTDTGSLYTWGDTYQQDVLGHRGVRCQPKPKKVPGVHRVVSVSAAKEHTVLLVGGSFPQVDDSSFPPTCLENLAAKQVAAHIDLFNILPITIMAERTQNACLLKYCYKFVALNLDGVLNFCRKSEVDCYLNEQLLYSSCSAGFSNGPSEKNDRKIHPFIHDFVLAGSASTPSFGRGPLCSVSSWLGACLGLHKTFAVQNLIRLISTQLQQQEQQQQNNVTFCARRTLRALSFADSVQEGGSMRKDSFSSPPQTPTSSTDRCLQLASNIQNIATIDIAEEKLASLLKEMRGTRKKLGQIERLRQHPTESLSQEQEQKLARRPQLESDLQVLATAVDSVKQQIQDIECAQQLKVVTQERTKEQEVIVNKQKSLDKSTQEKQLDKNSSGGTSAVDDTNTKIKFRCEICNINCPDEKSHELHMNGRKHRNKLAQVANEEKQQIAANIMQENHLQDLKQSTAQSLTTTTTTAGPPPKSKSASPWKVSDKDTSCHPRYKLPPPPHPVVDFTSPTKSRHSTQNTKSDIVVTPTTPKTLREIMQEEKNATIAASADNMRRRKNSGSGGGSAIVSSPQMASRVPTTPTLKPPSNAFSKPPTKTLKEIMQEETAAAAAAASDASPVSPKNANRMNRSVSNKVMVGGSLLLPPGSAPPMKSPPWASAPTVAVGVTTHITKPVTFASAPSPSPSPLTTKRAPSSSLLGNSIGSPGTKTPNRKSAGWGSPNVKMMKSSSTPTVVETSPPSTTTAAVSLLHIQQQEQEFKSKQDKSCEVNTGGNGKWYIEQRERAGSIQQIQFQAQKAREERLFIEEQIEIEKQIFAEIAAKKKAEEEAAEKKKKQKSKNRKKGNNNNNKNCKNNGNKKGNVTSKNNNNNNNNNHGNKLNESPSNVVATTITSATPSTTNNNKNNTNNNNNKKNNRKKKSKNLPGQVNDATSIAS